MVLADDIRAKLETGFPAPQADLLATVLVESHAELVRRADMLELTSVAKDIARSLNRTEGRIEELAVAQGRTEAKLEELATAQGRTEAKVEELAAAQIRTEIVVGKLVEAQTQTTLRLDKVEARLDGVDARLDRITEIQAETSLQIRELTESHKRFEDRLDRVEIRLAAVDGRSFEMVFRERFPSYIGLFMKKARVIQASELVETLGSALDPLEAADVLRADVVARGRIDGDDIYVVGEISCTIHSDDIYRAERRAGYLRKAGLPVVALVACETVGSQPLALARQLGVRVWHNGTVVDTAA
jgi:multidrug efflux pump subunit AcrA (membrane-fusion protein)